MRNEIKSTLLLTAIALCSIGTASAQIKAETICYPNTTKSLCGVEELDRTRFINVAGDSNSAKANFTKEQNDYLFKELGITFGRGLGMVAPEVRYGKCVREDSARPGYSDLKYLREKISCNDQGDLGYYKDIFGSNEMMAMHGKDNAYPDFMAKYNLTKEGNHGGFPENSDAAGELAANILKYKFSDFTRPQFYEPVNEPHWSYWSDKRFFEFHTQIKQHVDKLNLDVKVGGPCMSVSNFYGNNYQSTRSITKFIDATDNSLDFYSFHTYDYIKWDREKKEWGGQINSGAPLEGVFDAIASYTYNKYGKEFKYVATEHGGYVQGKSYGKTVDDARKEAFDYYAKNFFPGSGFKYEMERRSVDNFLMVSSAIANTMVFMNNPHIVLKSVPFILLDTSKWDPYYYATLYVREDFDKKSPNLIVSPLIYYYEFFKGVNGKYCHSTCNSGDIQHLAYRNDKEVILLYHNVSNASGEIAIALKEYNKKVKGATIRRVGRYDDSRKPYLTQEKMRDLSSFTIAPQESVAIFIPIAGAANANLTESAHYASEQSVQFKGSHTFKMNVANANEIKDATLRIGINRKNGSTKGLKIEFNGEELPYEQELSAERYKGSKGYTTTKVIQLPGSAIKGDNEVKISFTDGGDGGVGGVVLRALR